MIFLKRFKMVSILLSKFCLRFISLSCCWTRLLKLKGNCITLLLLKTLWVLFISFWKLKRSWPKEWRNNKCILRKDLSYWRIQKSHYRKWTCLYNSIRPAWVWTWKKLQRKWTLFKMRPLKLKLNKKNLFYYRSKYEWKKLKYLKELR